MSHERLTYHHGNLRTALVDAGLELTRSGGPGALSLREATRRAGVSPTAAYRHFADREALLAAIAVRVQDAMAERMASYRSDDKGPDARLRAVGLGYIDFAVTEPGWFELAFFGPESGRGPRAADTDLTPVRVPPPFALLTAALDHLVETGVLSVDDRVGAEWPCWSAVHGFAELVVHGPLHGRPRAEISALAARTVDVAITGVLAGR